MNQNNQPVNHEQNAAPVKLSSIFPKMKEIKSAPSLGSFNGIGTSMIGSRDGDQNTGTYIKTYVFTFIFIPLLALGAYRVANSENGGWYFLGKEKLSGFARAWNYLIILTVISFISLHFYDSYTKSPDYRAKQAIEKAEQQIADGEIIPAIQTYEEAYKIRSSHKESIANAYTSVVDKGLESDEPETVVEATRLLLSSSLWKKLSSEYPNLYEESIQKAVSFKENPRSALDLVNTVKPIAGADTKWVKVKQTTLENLAATQTPVDIKVAEELTEMYHELGDFEKIIALLTPIKGSLDQSHAAMSLGSAYLSMGQAEEAIPLLESYLEPRQKKWTEAANKIEATYEREYNEIIAKAQNGGAPDSVYKRLEATASEVEQQEIVNEYVEAQLKKGSAFIRYQRILEKNPAVPEAIMNLGIAHLRVAQNDPTKRALQLGKAESTLLSLQSYAGDSPNYKLFLGQVYYWLGKPTEGKAQFDSLIKSTGNSFDILMNISNTLRDVGRVDEALKLSETAYSKAITQAQKNESATFRAILTADLEEAIEWLEKADQKDPDVIIRLNSQKAHLAIQNNEVDKAITLYKKALQGFSNQPVNSTTLNNSALIHFSMFQATGEINHYNDGLNKIEQAVKLTPNDSILCFNAASFFISAAAQDLLKDKLEPKLIQQGVSISQVIASINSQEELDSVSEKIKSHPNYKKACQYLDRAVLLAPQNLQIYSTGISNYGAVSDLPRLKQLLSKYKESKVDTSKFKTEWLKSLDEIDIATFKNDIRLAKEYNHSVYESLTTESGKLLTRATALQIGLSTWSAIPITDIDQRITELRSIAKQQPSSVSSSALRQALMTKACMDLANNSPEFLKWAEQSKFQIGNKSLLLLWLDHLEKPANTIEQHPSIKEALEMTHQRNIKFPKYNDRADWIVAKLIAPESAANIAANYFTNEASKLVIEHSFQLNSYLPETILHRTWDMMAQGNNTEAKAFYKEAQKSSNLLPDAY